MICLLVVLVKLSVLAKWLARKTPLRKLIRVKEIIPAKPRPKSAYDCFSVQFVSLFYCVFVLSLAVCNIFHTATPINQPTTEPRLVPLLCASQNPVNFAILFNRKNVVYHFCGGSAVIFISSWTLISVMTCVLGLFPGFFRSEQPSGFVVRWKMGFNR